MQKPTRRFRSYFAQLLLEEIANADLILIPNGHRDEIGMLTPHHHRVSPPPGAATVADVRSMLDSMGIRIPISALAPKQSIELTK